jgi:hypothetical protein
MAMMISKFHKIIESKLVWAVFAIVIVIAFVFMYMPGFSGGGAPKVNTTAGMLYGEKVEEYDFNRAYHFERLLFTINYGQINISETIDTLLEERAWTRLATLKKAERMGITASDKELVSFIENSPLFKNRQGQFDRMAYINVQQNVFPNMGIPPQWADTFFREQLLLQKMTQIPALGAIVTESEIKETFHIYNDTFRVEYATLPRSLAATVESSDEMAKAYYEANLNEFRTPEKVEVTYVDLKVVDYIEQVEASDEEVAAFYEQNRQRYLIEADASSTNAVPEYQPLEEVKEQIVAEIKTEKARELATGKADELFAELTNEGVVFSQVVENMGLKEVSGIPPFGEYDFVDGIDTSVHFAREAFSLQADDTHYFSEPLVGRDSVYIIKLNQRIAPFLPAFETVKADAMESARIEAEEMAYIEAANEALETIKEALGAGTAFTNAVTQFNTTAASTEPFSAMSDLSAPYPQQIKMAAVFADQGAVELIDTRDGKMVAYIAERIPADATTQLEELRKDIIAQLKGDKAGALVSAWQEALLKEADFQDLRKQDS